MNVIKNIIKGFNYLILYAVFIVLFNLLLLRFPLTNVFSFEFSVLNAVVISFLTGIYVIDLFKSELVHDKKRKKFNISFILYFFVILIIPAAISIINNYNTAKCPITEGTEFYLVITLPSVIIGAGLGAISYYFFRKFSSLAFIFLYLLILASPLIELYFNPQVYFYNPVFAYFPGTIYDESIKIDWKLISYRLFNLAFFGYSFYLIRGYLLRTITLTNKFITFLIIFLAAVFIYFAPDLNYSTSFSRLKSKLSAEVSTPHFNIYYPPDLDKKLITVIALHHEYYYSILTDFFKDTTGKKIESFLFKDSDQKKELLGTRNADISKPWQHAVYINYNDYDNTLRHEIAHCFTAEFGTGPLRLAYMFNPSLIEGAATSAAPYFDQNSIDYLAYLAYNNNFKINIKNLFSYLNFFKNVSSLSYIYAGSFSKYLIRTYGIERFKELYSSGDFGNIYGNPIDTLEKNYFTYLNNLNFNSNENSAYYYFGAKSIFYKVCPRYVANKLNDAWNLFYHKNYIDARNDFQNLLKMTDNYSAYIGLAESLVKLKRKTDAVNLLKKNIDKFNNTSNYYSLEFYLADLLAGDNKIKSADSLYSAVIKQNPERKIYFLSELRDVLFKTDDKLKDYINGSSLDRLSILNELNQGGYVYCSIPTIVNLASIINEDYINFLKRFRKNLEVNDYESSYAVFRLSEYMMTNLDFERAKLMAALSMRYKADNNFNEVLQSNFKMISWMSDNSEKIINQFKFINN